MNFAIWRRPSGFVHSLLVGALLAGTIGLFSLNSPAQTAAATKTGEPVTLNFSNAEIEAVARTMASITGFNVVVDPRVKGTLTLVTEKPISRAAAMNQFLAALRLQGFTMVESAGLYKVIPEADAKLQSAGVSVSENAPAAADLPAGNQISTQIFRLNFESANNMVTVLRPLISPNNTINANPGNNSLVITDYADNLRRLARIIAAMDVANATGVEVLTLKHAIAVDLAPLLLRLIESSGPTTGAGDTSFKTTLIAEPRSNTLIVRAANAARLALVRSLVDKLDQPVAIGSNGAAGNIYVVYLKNADATKLAVTLRAAMTGQTQTSPAPAAVGTPGTAAVTATGSSTGGQVQADAATNSLIITAPEPQYRQLRAVIDKLDSRRAQVLVESLIAEVSSDKAAQFGIQWQALLGAGTSTVGVLGTNFTVGGTNIFNLASAIQGGNVPASSAGGNFGLGHKINDLWVLGALANLLQSTGDGNVLATPTLLTLDNEEAKIVIGQNVPFVTGSYTSNNTSSGSVNPFTTVDRKDVGLTLKVRPQISENGTVKMVIYQEVSSIQAGTMLNPNGPTTNKRSIESTVVVDDGNLVVLGGLLQDEYSGNEQKIPMLGDVPGVGALFRTDTRERKKTNLMVFLRPVVVRSSTDVDALSMDRYDLMRSVQQVAQPAESVTVPINQAPVMGALPKAAGTRPVPAPLMTPALSDTWGGGPSSRPAPAASPTAPAAATQP